MKEKRNVGGPGDTDTQAGASPQSDDAPASLRRRAFLQIIGASVAAGALSGCRPPRQKIIPYVKQPPELTPGVAGWYASTCSGCSAACGALVKVMDGRPIKLEGNPEHPVSRGGLCAIGQGVVAGLYDHYRQRGPSRDGQAVTWAEADSQIAQALQRAPSANRQAALVTGSAIGPATQALIGEFLAAFPQGRHVIYDPFPFEALREAHRKAYGAPILPRYRFERADLVVAFGADFLGSWLSPVEFTKQWSAKRAAGGSDALHVQVEARMSLTGANADERHAMSPSEQAACLAATLMAVAGKVGAAAPDMGSVRASWTREVQTVADRLADALAAHRGRCLVVCDSGDVAVQTLALALNDLLGNVGTTVDTARPSKQWQGSDTQLASLIGAMQRGDVEVVIIHGCNPAYTWPRAKEFAEALARVPCSVATGCAPDETTRLAKWRCPAPHPLETWADSEPVAGVYSIAQPALRPLYRTRSLQDSLLKWSGKRGSFHQYLQDHWRAAIFPGAGATGDFAAFWDTALQNGAVETAAVPIKLGPLQRGVVSAALRQVASRAPSAGGYEVELFHSVAMRDGEPANNPWLQELPDPVTKITWGNWAAIAPKPASSLGIQEGEWLEVETADGGSLALPAHIQAGQHPGTISVALGYGRTEAGPIGNAVGVNAYPLVGLAGGIRRFNVSAPSVKAVANSPAFQFAKTQVHDDLNGRPIVGDVDEAAHHAHEASGHGAEAAAGHDHEEERRKANLWGAPIASDRQWGMVIDLDRCTGCSACVTACDMENNVPAVGPDEVRRSREMHWMRIDRYFVGDPEAPEVRHQPMLCQHCANASCESVCPVLATVHDDQGLNVQVYNRCVGTRYCANNCPYKVRRFNWFDNREKLAARRLGLNPSVTVRSRGVMEKCSFCIQRIQEARIRSRNEGWDVQDGEVRTACQQSCPADAIVFGDLQDPNSQAARLAKDERAFTVLEELNRQPAIRYLTRAKRTEVGA